MRRDPELFRPALVMLAATAVLIASPPARAQSEPTPSYELSIRNRRLVVNVDLQSFLSDEYLTRVKEGIDLILECRLGLKTPRRFFGSRTVAETAQSLRIGYRSITEDFVVRISTDWTKLRFFLTSDDIRAFLTDSIILPVASIDSLNAENQYTLLLRMTTISMTDLGLGRSAETADSARSPVEYLFHQFLTLTGFGRRESSFESRPFHMADLQSEP